MYISYSPVIAGLTRNLLHLILFVCFIGVFYSCKTKQTNADSGIALLSVTHIEQTVRSFSDAVQAKDTALVMPLVSPNFAVATTTRPSSRNYLQTIFERELIDSITLAADIAVVPKGLFKQEVGALVHLSGREPVKTNITFDGRDGTILYVDYFDSLYGLFRDRPARLMATLAIEQDEESSAIIVYLKLNSYDKPLRFLFDSGADGMAVSSELAAKAGVKASLSQTASVVGGNAQILVSSGNTVHLDSLQLQNQNIAIFEKVRNNIDGLIGLNLAKNFIVKVNFDEKKMYLYSFGTYEYEAMGETESITVPRGIIIIPGYLNLTGKDTVSGNFIFDTGAEYHFMGFSHFVREHRLLLSGFKPVNQSATTSMGITTPVYEGTAVAFGFGKSIKQTEMPVSLQASSGNSNWRPPADASIGIKLINNYNFTINLLEKEIHFTPRK